MIKVSTNGMVVPLKTDLRFPKSGQQGHGPRIIHLLDIQIYNFFRLQKNQYENFTNFVIPVKFPYWFSFIFYGFGIFYVFKYFTLSKKQLYKLLSLHFHCIIFLQLFCDRLLYVDCWYN